ncbi:MAG: glycoside hydrolase family 130 protein [Pseudomonadota bacterium]
MDMIKVKRKGDIFKGDSSRVIAKFFSCGGRKRKKRIIGQILKLSDGDSKKLLKSVLEDFSDRHHNIEDILLDHYLRVEKHLSEDIKLSKYRKLLIGSYFTHEYSIESAALFNPSIVPHPNQKNLNENSLRIILSFRGVGEGHVSSVVFRSGVLDKNNNIIIDTVSPYVETPTVSLNPSFSKHTFLLKLEELGAKNYISDEIFKKLPTQFSFGQLNDAIIKLKIEFRGSVIFLKTKDVIDFISQSNYEETFRKESDISERVIFPVIEDESNGIEDARFVLFTDDNGKKKYYATYTAYDGRTIFPMLLETNDFLTFKICTLNGEASKDKGMALFPRKINKQYTMISRIDKENIYIMQSNNIHFWNEAKLLQTPKYDWQFIQIGNCGSPIETKEGWLLLTHGVGPLRKYCIGAMLLDLENPAKVIGQLEKPLISPNEYEREGYVPNVVYTCGALLHNETLVIPYAVSDTASGIVTIQLEDLLNKLK